MVMIFVAPKFVAPLSLQGVSTGGKPHQRLLKKVL